MNSKWQINRIGLVDFWYYDEEEFYFLDGRMLLRGANGSGKSVTMQSFIPLLLDGNMRPERLDPFGSRARKMDNYLLEENDSREERTGYLYMEFKRTDSDTYLTIGIGMKARKGKALETWYFFLQDGRRIGKDFFLYRQEKSKITLSKQELKCRVLEGGKVLDSQKDYMAMVNRLIFGFETIEEYKEMIDLLIQLRTPKLSKDFKPTIINDILSNSLLPLSEDDLRPMSEAIENMDSLKTNLDNLKESRFAARKINRVYDRYNQMILLEKARQYKEGQEEYTSLGKSLKQLSKRIADNQLKFKETEETLISLTQEEEVRKEEERSLNASDARNLKIKQEQLLEEIDETKVNFKKKEENLTEKRERRIELEHSQKKKEEDKEQISDQIEAYLDEMEAVLEHITFDEHAFMAKDIREDMSRSYGFDTHRSLLERHIGGVDAGIEALRQEERQKERYDERLILLEDFRNQRDKKEKEVHQYENQLVMIKNELLELLYSWEKSNQEIILEDALMQRIATAIEKYDEKSDYGDIKELIRNALHAKESLLQTEHASLTIEKNKWQDEINQKVAERKEWESMTDPSPEVSEPVRRSREQLRAQGISYFEFYKTVDFHENLSAQSADRLEEALLSMGILDALIVSEEDRERILALDTGLCDKYIFSDIDRAKNNLLDLLDVDNEQNDILFYQQISRILSGIGYCGEEGFHTEILEDGSYLLGALSGTVTKQYSAKYIGVKTREKYRKEKIQELTEEISVLKAQEAAALKKVHDMEKRIAMLKEEWSRFPNGEDLKVALKSLLEVQDQLDRLYREVQRNEEMLQKEQQHLAKLQETVREICAKVYLTAKLAIFLEAKDSLMDYSKLLTKLHIAHEKYKESFQYLINISEQLEEIDQDLDYIYKDLQDFNRKLEQLKKSLDSVNEQLALTNYEEIKEKLDACLKRLKEIPSEREACIRMSQDLKKGLELDTRDKAEAAQKLDNLERKVKCVRAGFVAEVKLEYADYELKEEIAYELCQKVFKDLESAFGLKKREDITGDLQEVYHQNRGFLPEFQLTFETLFEALETEEFPELNFKRLDITAKYRGVAVKFKELLEKIEKDIQEQTNLLGEQDRELFEDILTNTIGKKIRAKIYNSTNWVDNMNRLMGAMETSSGLTLSLKWKSKRAEHEEQLDTGRLVKLLKKDSQIMNDENLTKLSAHFRSKIQEARKLLDESDTTKSFHMIMREILDYRKWFEFQLEFRMIGENKKELTDRVFFTFSGGEKAMAMYVPLFSAVVAKYKGARDDAPRLISLDEAFAGVDEINIKDMFRLMVEFDFSFIINSQILWGDYESVPKISIYQLLRPDNAKFVSVIHYIWNGKKKELVG